MRPLLNFTAPEAREYFLKGSSYFNCDFPSYIDFGPLLALVDAAMKGNGFTGIKKADPSKSSSVNYRLDANKDGRMAWRPYELIHPAIYVSLVNVICEEDNWAHLKMRFCDFEKGIVECCSLPVISTDIQSNNAAQVKSWWQTVEQRSIVNSLEYSHVLHTDVTNCYGALYSHSISWALHGLETAKENRSDKDLLGNKIDRHIQAGRYGQTNGIPQGSALMDLVAETVLGYVDLEISKCVNPFWDFQILRYRDDYRIFANSDRSAEAILKLVSDKLKEVGMALGPAKTFLDNNVVGGSIKKDKMAGIALNDLGNANAKTIQKRLLRLHSFGRQFPNSGTLKRLLSEVHTEISKEFSLPSDLEVQVAIATDIAFVSPQTIPAVAGILSHLISRAQPDQKSVLWGKVVKKMKKIPHNGYLEVWLQRVVKAQSVGGDFTSPEPICRIVAGEEVELWGNDWIASAEVLSALDVSKIVVGSVQESEEVIMPEEVELFRRSAWAY